MGLLVDKLEGVEPAEVVELIAREVEENRERIMGLEDRVSVAELGSAITEERLMLVALDERLLAMEARLDRLLARLC